MRRNPIIVPGFWGALTVCVLCLSFPVPIRADMSKPQTDPAKKNGSQGRFLGLREAIDIALKKHPSLLDRKSVV